MALLEDALQTTCYFLIWFITTIRSIIASGSYRAGVMALVCALKILNNILLIRLLSLGTVTLVNIKSWDWDIHHKQANQIAETKPLKIVKLWSWQPGVIAVEEWEGVANKPGMCSTRKVGESPGSGGEMRADELFSSPGYWRKPEWNQFHKC